MISNHIHTFHNHFTPSKKNNPSTRRANYVWYVSQWLQFMILSISSNPALLWEKMSVGLSAAFLVCAALKVSMHHLFLQTHKSPGAQPAPPLFRCSSSRPDDRLKQYFWCSCCLRLSSAIPECQHSGGWLPRERIILFQSRTVCPFKSPSTKATLMYALCPSHMTFKVTLGAQACTFNKISPMHYMDEFFLLATHLNHVHASSCVDMWYLWTEARQYKSKKMGLVSLTKQK